MNKQLQKEILQLKEDMEKLGDRGLKPILKAYRKSLDGVRAEIAKLYMKYGKLEEMSRQDKYKELKKIEKLLLNAAQELGVIDTKETTKILKEVYSESYYKTYFTIQKGVQTEIPLTIIGTEFIKAAIEMPIEGKMFSVRIWDNKAKLVARIRKSVEKAMTQGTSIDKLAREIKNNFGASAYESKRLIHTEVARCQSQAQDEIYKNSDLVKQVMYDATLDDRTSEICESLDSKTFDANSDYPKPPQHPNCRSAIIPVVEGWKPTKKRDNESKEIIDYSSYEEWKKSRNIS